MGLHQAVEEFRAATRELAKAQNVLDQISNRNQNVFEFEKILAKTT